MNTGQSVYVNVWIYGYVWMYVWGGQSKRSAKEDASLLKITFFSRIKENLDVESFSLTDQEMQEIDKLGEMDW